MRFFRFIFLVVVLVCILFATHQIACAQAMTSITATTVDAGSGPVTGTLCAKAVNQYGTPISVTKSGGGMYLKDRPFCQILTAGVLAGALNVPNSVTDSAPGHAYDLVVYDTSSGIQTDLGAIYGIGGATWSLDSYQPSYTVPTTSAFTFTTGTGAAPTSCVEPAIYAQKSASGATVSICNEGVFVPIAGDGSVATVLDNSMMSSRLHQYPWDDMDAPDGTLLSSRISPSGVAWQGTGAGWSTAYIQNGGWLSTANTYAALMDTRPITGLECVFSWQPSATYPTVGQGGTCAITNTASPADALIHMTFDNNSYNLQISYHGGPTNWSAGTGIPPVEVNGIAEAAFGQFLTPLKLDGTRYKMRFDLSGDVLTMRMPDGTVWQYTDPQLATVASVSDNHLGWMGGFEQIDWAGAPLTFNGFLLGPSKEGNLASTSDVQTSKLNAYLGNPSVENNIVQVRQSAKLPITSGGGWYTIATQHPLSVSAVMAGTVTVYGSDTGGRAAYLKIQVGAESGDTQAQSVLTVTPFAGQWGGGVVDQVRLSQDGGNNIQLDVHTINHQQPGTLILAFEGNFTPAPSAVGANPLSTYSKTVSVVPSVYRNDKSVTFTVPDGTTGWYTIATNDVDLGGNNTHPYMQGSIRYLVTDNAGRQQLGKFSVDQVAAGRTPVFHDDLSEGDNYGGYVIDQFRASTDDTALNGQLDLHVGTSNGATVTIWYDGFFTPTLLPVNGATPLATTSTAYSVGSSAAPATAPTGTCTVSGTWVFSQDGHASFCNGTTWASKI